MLTEWSRVVVTEGGCPPPSQYSLKNRLSEGSSSQSAYVIGKVRPFDLFPFPFLPRFDWKCLIFCRYFCCLHHPLKKTTLLTTAVKMILRLVNNIVRFLFKIHWLLKTHWRSFTTLSDFIKNLENLVTTYSFKTSRCSLRLFQTILTALLRLFRFILV